MTPSGSCPGTSGYAPGWCRCTARRRCRRCRTPRRAAAPLSSVDLGYRQLAQLELARSGLHDRATGAGRHRRLAIARTPARERPTLTGPGTPPRPGAMTLARLTLRRDPLDVLACIAGEPGAFLIEVPDPEHPAAVIGCRPTAELCLRASDPDPAAAIARFVAAAPSSEGGLPFPLAGGVVACLTYELGVGMAPRPIHHAPVDPLAVLRRYDPVLVLDRRRSAYALVGSGPSAMRAPWLERLARPAPGWHGPLGTAPLAATMAAERYRSAVRDILAYLAAGDCYQVNLTQPFTAPLAAPAWALLDRLARRHPAPYTAYLDLGDPVVVANSPELLLRRRGRRVETQTHQGHATARRPCRRGRRAPSRAVPRSQGARRARHDRRSGAQRPRPRVRAGQRPRRRARAGRKPSEPAPSRLRRLRDAARRGRHRRAARGHVSRRVDHRRAEGARDGDHRRAGGVPARGLHRGARSHRTRATSSSACRSARPSSRTDHVRWHAGGGIVADSDPERELAEAWLKTAALRLALGETPGAELDRCSSG